MNMIKILAGAALVIASAGEIAAQSSQMALDFLANRWGQPLSEQYESAARWLRQQWDSIARGIYILRIGGASPRALKIVI